MDISHLLLYILGCILLIGFFAGTEIAFISANKLNIELRKKQGKFSGQILARFMENPSEFIGTSLVGVNVLVVVYGLLASDVTTKLLHNYNIVLLIWRMLQLAARNTPLGPALSFVLH